MTGPISSSNITIQFYKNGATAMAVLGGALRLQNSDFVRQQLSGLMALELERFYLHLAQLYEVDSSGLGLLVGLHMTARKKKIELILLAPTAQQMKLFEATRLNAVLNLQTGVEAVNVWNRLACDEFAFTLPANPA